MRYFSTKALLSCFALLFLFSFSAFCQNINLLWAKGLEGATESQGKGIQFDSQGNVYFWGYFRGTADFDFGTNTFNLSSPSGGSTYILKTNSSGEFIWAIKLEIGQVDYMTLDNSDNIYLVGNFVGTADFDPSPNTFNLSAGSSRHGFIVKLNNLGEFIWAKQIRGPETFVKNVVLDDSGNVYTTGNFTGATDFDPNTNIYTLNTQNISLTDSFILKLDALGNFMWVKQIGGVSEVYSNDIKLDNSNNIYSIGRFIGTTDFDPGTAIYNLNSSSVYSNYILKLNSLGDFIWVKQIVNNSDYGKLEIDNLQYLYISNTFTGTIDFNPGTDIYNMTAIGTKDISILKIDNNGEFIWAKQIGGTGTNNIEGISVDISNDLYMIGSFQGTTDFDPNSTSLQLSSAGGKDIFTCKLNSSGSLEWSKKFGVIIDGEDGLGISVNLQKEICLTGVLLNTIDFDPNVGITNVNGSGGNKSFFTKYKQCPAAGFSPSSLPFAVLGETYSQTLSQTVLNGTISWVLLEGSLPTGMFLNTSTGAITGTPTVAGTYNFVIEATNGSCSDTKNYSIVVGCPTASISPNVSSLPTALQSQPYSQTLTQTGLSGTITWTTVSGSLPTSFNLNTSTGIISSTNPNVLGNFTFTVRASNGFCSVDRVYSINVVCPTIEIAPPNLSDATQGIAYNANFAQTGLVGINITWSIVSGGLPVGITLNSNTGVIAGTANSVGTYNFTVRVSNGICSQTKAYTLRVVCPNLGIAPSNSILNPVTQGISYTQTFTATGITFGTALWTFLSGGTLPTGITFNSTTGQISGSTMDLGTYSFTLLMENGSCSVTKTYTLEVVCPNVNIAPIVFPTPFQGLPYSQSLSQNQMIGNITWSVVSGSLPTGLTLNSSTGEISGTITNTNSFTFTVQVSNGTCSEQKTYTIQATCPTGKINPNILPNGKQDVSYNQRFTQQGLGGTMSWQIVSGNLPAGITLNSSTGVLSGIPTQAGNYTFKVRVSNGVCNTEQEYPFVIETPTSLSSNINQGGFKIYPNPTEKELWIETENGKTWEGINITILDVWGRRLESSYSFKQLNSSTLQITTENLPSGEYILQIQVPSSIPFVAKFVKK